MFRTVSPPMPTPWVQVDDVGLVRFRFTCGSVGNDFTTRARFFALMDCDFSLPSLFASDAMISPRIGIGGSLSSLSAGSTFM